MQRSLQVYRRNREWAFGFGQLYIALRGRITVALDLSDILRGSFVFGVSAFDAFIRDLVSAGMESIFDGDRAETMSYRQQLQNVADAFAATTNEISKEEFLFHIRQRSDQMSYQNVKSVANAIRSIAEVDVWDELARTRGVSREDVVGNFEVIMNRRHTIVHRADVLPVLGGYRNDIDIHQVLQADEFLSGLAQDITRVVG